MSGDILPTVVVEGQNGEPLIINLSKYEENKDSYKLYDNGKKTEKSKVKFSIVEEDELFKIVDKKGQIVGEPFKTKEEAEQTLSILLG